MYTIIEKNSPLGDENKVLGEFPGLENSKIIFDGVGNVLYCEPGVRLRNSTIEFRGNNSLIYLSESRYQYFLSMVIYHQSNCFFGKHNYMNGPLKAILSERKNIVVGEEGQFSFGIWMRLADPHLIYDVKTRKRINPSRSIYIGDHVWIGQGATLLRGTKVGSGSIIGAMGVISGGSASGGGGSPLQHVLGRMPRKDGPFKYLLAERVCPRLPGRGYREMGAERQRGIHIWRCTHNIPVV